MRLFFAISPEYDEQKQFKPLLTELATLFPNESGQPRLTCPKVRNLHFTAKFLGETPISELSALCKLASEVTKSHHAFKLRLDRVVRLGTRNRPVYALAPKAAGAFENLARDLESTVGNAGFPKSRKLSFRAHMTVARGKNLKREHDKLVRASCSNFLNANPIHVTQICLIKSALHSDGAEYSQLATFPLKP